MPKRRAAATQSGQAIAVESAGTGDWHAGEPPDPRAQAVALHHGIDISGYRARQIEVDDFRRFDLVLALDADNLAALRRIAPDDARATLSLLLDYVPGLEGQAVSDPYYGGEDGFETTWSQVSAAARALIERYDR